MPESSSGLQYLVIDGSAADFYPPEIRRAAELLAAYLDGVTAGRMMQPSDRTARDAINEEAGRAAAGVGEARTPMSACGTILGSDSGHPHQAPAVRRDIVVVWGPGAAGTVEQILSS